MGARLNDIVGLKAMEKLKSFEKMIAVCHYLGGTKLSSPFFLGGEGKGTGLKGDVHSLEQTPELFAATWKPELSECSREGVLVYKAVF